jgi:hypothetical protein
MISATPDNYETIRKKDDDVGHEITYILLKPSRRAGEAETAPHCGSSLGRKVAGGPLVA